MGVVILACSCKHAYQDQRYGAGKRVFNLTANKSKYGVARCTVCLYEKR